MKIIEKTMRRQELEECAAHIFGDMVKAVVDVNKEILAVDAELHSDLESVLIENGSHQKDLWGINFYPQASVDDFIEFDSMINVRPSQGNMSRSVENLAIQKKIIEIVKQRIT